MMHMSEVVQFPGSKKDPISAEQQEIRNAAKHLEETNLKRKGSLEQLTKRVKNIMENEKINATHMSPASVEVLREASIAFSAALAGLEAHDAIIDMITHDIVGLVQNLDQLSTHLFQTGAFTQTLIEVLKAKGILTQEEMKETWAKMVKEKAPVSPE
jgi:hypothetical protein